jgi:uncharacterized protein involved in outer membrane biogenesis
MRRIRIVLGIVAAVFVLGFAAIWLLTDPNRYRETIQARLEKQLGRQVSLGEMSIGFLPPRFEVSNPVVSEDPSLGQTTPFVQAEKLDIRVALLPLFSGKIQIDSIQLRRPSVELIKTRKGTWNFSTLAIAARPSGEEASPPGEKRAGDFVLSRFEIVDGQVAITDHSRSPSRKSYEHIDLTLVDYMPGKPFSFDLALRTPGQGAQEVRLTGDAGPIASKNPSETPVRAVLNLKEVALDAMSARGLLSGEGKIESQAGRVAANGRLELAAARVNGLETGYPIGLDYRLGANIADGVVTIEAATLQLGETPLFVDGSLMTAATPPVLDLKIKSGDASIKEIARLAAAFGVAFAPGTTVNGRLSADVRAKGPMTRPALSGTIAGRDLHISGKSVPQPVQIRAVDLALSPSSIQSNEFNATSGKTTVVGRVSLLQYASPSPSVDLTLRAPGATLPEIQSIAKAYGFTGLDQISGEGTMNFDLRAQGPLKSINKTAATRAVNGTINLDFKPLKVDGFDTVHELSKLAGVSSARDGRATDIVRVIGRIVVNNGIARTDDLRAQLDIGNLLATGTADLATESLDLRLSAVFSKEFTEKVGGTRRGQLVNAALTNSAGELIVPAIVTGTFKQPKFAPDLQAVARLQQEKLLPKLSPGILAPIQGILDLFKKKK